MRLIYPYLNCVRLLQRILKIVHRPLILTYFFLFLPIYVILLIPMNGLNANNLFFNPGSFLRLFLFDHFTSIPIFLIFQIFNPFFLK